MLRRHFCYGQNHLDFVKNTMQLSGRSCTLPFKVSSAMPDPFLSSQWTESQDFKYSVQSALKIFTLVTWSYFKGMCVGFRKGWVRGTTFQTTEGPQDQMSQLAACSAHPEPDFRTTRVWPELPQSSQPGSHRAPPRAPPPGRPDIGEVTGLDGERAGTLADPAAAGGGGLC